MYDYEIVRIRNGLMWIKSRRFFSIEWFFIKYIYVYIIYDN